MSGVCATSFTSGKLYYLRMERFAHILPAWYKLHVFLTQVSADRNSLRLPDFEELAISVHTIYLLEC